MSYQFSFLQAFAGYYFVGSRFLTISIRNVLSKRSQAKLRVHVSWQFETMRLEDIGKYRTHICYRLRHFRLVSLYWTAIGYRILTYRCLCPTINRLNNLNNHYFTELKKFLNRSSSDWISGYIFDTYLNKCLCKYLLQSKPSKNRKILGLQSHPDCRICQSILDFGFAILD
mgnify:FL=1